ncbi:MAG: 4-hydroxy-tetrahydrodipicolinate synthase [Myxococcaceae bacterium]
MRTFEGSLVALATPFRRGTLDEEAYARFIEWQIAEGTQGLVPIGTTGEASTLSHAERAQAVAIAVATAKGRVPVVAGAGSNSTAETIEGVGRVRDAGADGALLVTPYYNKPMQAGLVAHYRAVASAHPKFPLVVYNVPSRTGVDLLPETMAQLSDVPEVVAIKEATASMIRAIDLVERCGERFTLLSGDDFTVAPFIGCGGRGVISVSANVVPKWMADVVKAMRANDVAKARELQVKLNRLHQLLFVESNPIPVKWALAKMGKMQGDLRLPLTELSASNAKAMETELVKMGLLS